jgi:hypothetical protein
MPGKAQYPLRRGEESSSALTLTTWKFGTRRMKQAGVRELTPIRDNPEIGLRSFFFKGPEGYDFEIQEFVRPQDREVFLPRRLAVISEIS